MRIFTVRDNRCEKVMFSQACVKNSVWGGGMHGRGRMCGRGGCMAGGACMAGGVCGRGIHVWWGGGGQVIKRARSEIISSMAVR